ncbi:hypothetical protein LIER_17347 [Lithospermum erythrorhizon]|uniref:Zinc finger, CCHC-type n=1 Tax=Lithospermum erythrorhizon TaxID=34254 RepID=A0AAV3QA23_LITER
MRNTTHVDYVDENQDDGNPEYIDQANENQGKNGITQDTPSPAQPVPPPQGRVHRQPVWMQDYVTGKGLSDDEVHMVLDHELSDPTNFEEATKCEKWEKAMRAELNSIEKNGTWTLTLSPQGGKTIGVK